MTPAQIIRDRIEALWPTTMTTYLRSRGWQRAGTVDDRATVWTLGDVEVLVPQRRELRDFGLRMAEVLFTLEAVEQRSRLEILDAISSAGADVVRLRLIGPELNDGRLGLARAGQVLDRTRELLTAAACSVIAPRALHGAKRPGVATEWIEQLQLAAPEAGSFVLKVVSDVPPALEPQGSLLLEDEPFGRRAAAVLMRAVTEARSAAELAAETRDSQPFEAAVAQGVSANLCESLAAIVDAAHAQTLDLGVQWAAHRFSPPGVPERVLIGADVVGVLREAGRLLRARAPQEEFELEGWVVTLSRPGESPASGGTAVVAGLVDGHVRKVRVELAQNDYTRAGEAHLGGRRVRFLGTLVKEGRGYSLRDPHGFEIDVIDDPGGA